MSSGQDLIKLIDEDPDIAAGLTGSERALARAAMVASAETVAQGQWEGVYQGEHVGALVLDGLLLREMKVADRPSAELLGAGDVLLPLGTDEVTFVPRPVSWRALTSVRVAWLGSPVLAAWVQWPSTARVLHERAERRIARVMAMQSLAHLPRVEDRVLGVLWLLAERWGRVTQEGTVLPLPLTHRTLGQLVGAQRPSVTGALGALGSEGAVLRGAENGWVLAGRPPAFLRTSVEGRQDGAASNGAVG